jgi:hypothetical protein
MTDLLTTMVVTAVSNGGLLALFIWVFKSSFEKALDKSVKLYERELDLRHKKDFHQFSKTYDLQAETLRDIYKVIANLYDRASQLGFIYDLYEQFPDLLEKYRVPKTGDSAAWERYLKASLSEKEEDIQAGALAKAASSALSEFRPNRIYLTVTTADEIECLLNLFQYVGASFQSINYRDPEDLQTVVAPEVVDSWKKAILACQQLFPKIEGQFREHLGASGGA